MSLLSRASSSRLRQHSRPNLQLVHAPRRIETAWWEWDAQQDLETEVFWITGGLGSGKTHGGCGWYLERCFLNAKSPISWAVAPTHSKVMDILLRKFQELLWERYSFKPGRDYTVHLSKPPRIVFKRFRHEIYLHSGVRPDLMIGTEISHFLITEVGSQKQDVYTRCMERRRHPGAAARQGMCEGTPEGLNWYAEKANFEDFDPVNKYRRFKLRTADNLMLMQKAPEYLPMLLREHRHNPPKLRSYTEGEFCAFNKGGVYSNFLSGCKVSDVRPSPYKKILFQWDFNHRPLAWVTTQRLAREVRGRRRDQFVAVGESDGTSDHLDDGCYEFVQQFPVDEYRDTEIELWGDRSGHAGSHKIRGSDYTHIKGYLLDAGYKRVKIFSQREITPVAASAEQVNKLFLYEEYVVAAWCKNLVRSYEETTWKPGVRGVIEKKEDDDVTHWQEATRSCLWKLTRGWKLEQMDRVRAYGANWA